MIFRVDTHCRPGDCHQHVNSLLVVSVYSSLSPDVKRSQLARVGLRWDSIILCRKILAFMDILCRTWRDFISFLWSFENEYRNLLCHHGFSIFSIIILPILILNEKKLNYMLLVPERWNWSSPRHILKVLRCLAILNIHLHPHGRFWNMFYFILSFIYYSLTLIYDHAHTLIVPELLPNPHVL